MSLRSPKRPVVTRLACATGSVLVLAACGIMLLGFTPPKEDQRRLAVGSLANLKAADRVAYTDHGEFVAKRIPEASDWLAQHREPGQTFDQYIQSRPNRPDSLRKTLYILPLGKFEKGKAPDLKTLQTFMAAYYHPLPVKFLPVVPDEKVKAARRVHFGNPQWNSLDVLDWMKTRLPRDAYAMVAVTMTDLYPKDSWNFVFGQASLKNRVGVFSFARYHPSFHGKAVDDDTPRLVLLRAAKVLSHETGHMFGIHHCIYYECNMNGANHLKEADQTPIHLCPVCLRKLHHGLRVPPAERYQKLEAFYRAHGMREQAKWLAKRLERMK